MSIVSEQIIPDDEAERLAALRRYDVLDTPQDGAYGTRVVVGEVASVRATTRASGANELEVELVQVAAPQGEAMRAGTSGRSADDLVELGVRNLFRGEALPESLGCSTS